MNKADGIQILLNLCGLLGHHQFFTDKLWKEVRGFECADESEILAYFMIAALHDEGIYYCGSGMSWGSPCDKETCEQYMKKFSDVRKAYRDWCISRR
jgi:hypothetical protein